MISILRRSIKQSFLGTLRYSETFAVKRPLTKESFQLEATLSSSTFIKARESACL